MRFISLALFAATLTNGLADSLNDAANSITGGDILKHIRVLSSDEFEGRAPATKGEELTVNYLIDQFKKIGLQPGNPDGSWTQPVPMVGVTSTWKANLTQNGKTTDLIFPQDMVGWSQRIQPNVAVTNSEIIFVGYGVEAPEYGWDDYKGLDVKGKTLMFLINDPAVPDPKDPKKLDENLFKGNAMTYYGRWTYKYEIAASKGAAGAIVIHETGPAGYPYFVVINSNSRENFRLKDSKGTKLPFESWMSLDRAKTTLAAAGQNFDDLKQRAIRKDFKPVPLGITLDVNLTNTMRDVRSQNVVAKLPGAGTAGISAGEYIIYTAHWDHLGKDPKREGDQIFNGAMDNASGLATMLEVAEAFNKLKTPPKRSILFLAVTAEEKGLLGAKYYAEHPLYPLTKTLANFNMDGASIFGRRSDLGIVGLGNSTLDDLVIKYAQTQNRKVRNELSAEKGFYYRSDHFEFAKVGVPALYLDKIEGEYPNKPADYGKNKLAEYLDKKYHLPSDEIADDWDMTGAVDDTQILFQAGAEVANATQWPEWKHGTEFRSRRESMLKESK